MDNVYRAEAIVLQEQLASSQETHSETIKELRRERMIWRADKKELEQLRKMISNQENLSISMSEVQYMRELLEEQAKYEEIMDEYADQVKELKQNIQSLQQTNKSLNNELEILRRSRNGPSSEVKDLEEQLQKWEMLYFESAEQGAKKIEKLEQEIEELREGKKKGEKEIVEEEMPFDDEHRSEKSYLNKTELEEEKDRFQVAAEATTTTIPLDEIEMLDQIENLERELRKKDIKIERVEYEKRKAEIKLAEEKAKEKAKERGIEKDPFSGIAKQFQTLFQVPNCANDNVCVNVVYRRAFPDAYY